MANFAVIISSLSILGLVVGVIYPKWGLFWHLGRKSRRNAIAIYTFLLILSFLLFAVTEGTGG